MDSTSRSQTPAESQREEVSENSPLASQRPLPSRVSPTRNFPSHAACEPRHRRTPYHQSTVPFPQSTPSFGESVASQSVWNDLRPEPAPSTPLAPSFSYEDLFSRANAHIRAQTSSSSISESSPLVPFQPLLPILQRCQDIPLASIRPLRLSLRTLILASSSIPRRQTIHALAQAYSRIHLCFQVLVQRHLAYSLLLHLLLDSLQLLLECLFFFPTLAHFL